MRRPSLKWLPPFLLLFLAGQPVRGEGPPPMVRVGLLQHAAIVPFVAVQGGTIACVSATGEPATMPAGETWTAQSNEGGVKILKADGSCVGEFRPGVCVTPAEGSTTRVSGIVGHWDKITDREYRGTIEIRPDPTGLTVVNAVDVETYLRGVVSSEMPYTYPLAALQAQAVAARGQAIVKASRHESEGFGPCATAHCQVYGGATSERATTDQAVSSTKGEVLVYEGRIADTLYSSNCGGHTANMEDFWEGATPVPYLRGVEDFAPEDKVPYTFPLAEEQAKQYLKYAPRVNCNQSQLARTDKIRWWMVLPRGELQKRVEAVLGDIGDLVNVQVVGRGESGIVTRLTVIGTKRTVHVAGGAQTRRAMGGLDSASFAIEPIAVPEGKIIAFVVWGAGWGHQVGMCQVGAAGLAQKGWDYRRILAKYYRGTKVEARY